MAWEDVESKIVFWQPGAWIPDPLFPPGVVQGPDQTNILELLEQWYNSPGGIGKAAIDAAILRYGVIRIGHSDGGGLTIHGTANNAGYFVVDSDDNPHDHWLTPDGRWVEGSLSISLLHEMMHLGWQDEDPPHWRGVANQPLYEATMNGADYNYAGAVVTKVNAALVLAGLGDQQRSSYQAVLTPDNLNNAEFESGISYTGGTLVSFSRIGFRGRNDTMDISARTDGASALMFGLDGSDTIIGNSGNDFLYGGDGNDELVDGGAGNDHLYGGDGNDLLVGGEGNDEIWGDAAPFQTQGQNGTDTVSYADTAAGIVATITATGSVTSISVADGEGGTDSLHSIEKIVGTSARDEFKFVGQIGNGLNLTVNAGGGQGAQTSDHLDGAQLTEGMRLTITGDGTGTIRSRSGGTGVINLENFHTDITGSDFDDEISDASDGEKNIDAGDGDDEVTIGGGTATVSGGDGQDRITGGEGDDTLLGDGDDDIIIGGEGSDTISGGAGKDRLDGGDDDVADILEGGDGFDVFAWNGGDVIKDPERVDRLEYDGTYLTGGSNIRDEDGNSSNRYRGAHGEIYEASGTSLTITLPNGEIMTVENWEEGELGIGLTEEPPPPRDPLILDLDNDGLELSSYAESSVFFDIDADGIAERMAWTRGGDAFLVRDTGDAGITNGTELFTFASLAAFDTNFDRVIDADDAVYAELKVWRDTDLDGVSDFGELQTLAEAGIVSISLLTRSSDLGTVAGNDVLRYGGFTRSDNSQGVGYDVDLRFSNTTTQGGSGSILPETLLLPELFGRGDVLNLRTAMSSDPTLLAMVQALALTDASSMDSFVSQVEAIIYRWHEVENAPEALGAGFLDSRQIATLLTLRGTALTDQGLNGDTAAMWIENWHAYRAQVVSDLFAQLPIAQDLIPGMQLAMGAFLQIPSGTSLATVLSDLADAAPSGLEEQIGYWSAMSQILGRLKDQFDVDGATFRALVNATLEAQGLPFTYTELRDATFGTTGNDVLFGQAEYDDDLLPWGTGPTADIFIGGAGDDHIRGGLGSDHYIFGLGDGHDVIEDESDGGGLGGQESNGFDRIHFLSGIALTDLVFVRPAGTDDLIITIAGTTDQITIRNQFRELDTAIDELVFADGSTVSWSAIVAQHFPAGSGNDYVIGSNDANDTLAGGAGTDLLEGGQGNDTYVFNLGDGSDTIIEHGGDASDVLLFGPGILPADVTVFVDSQQRAYVFVIAGTSDRVILRGSGVDSVQFDNGTSWTWQDVAANFNQSSNGNDLLFGTSGNDVFDGGAGSDTIHGVGGDDIYHFGRGYGRDRIIEESGADRVQFGAGISLSDLSIRGVGSDLVIQIIGTADILTITNYLYSPGGNYENRIEEFRFADGSVLSQSALTAALLAGTAGDDDITGTSGNDNLDGGAGSDVLRGGGGSDTFHFGIGYGDDRIENYYPQLSRVLFGAGITPADLILSVDTSGTLIVRIANTTDTLTLSYFMASESQIGFEFANGTILTPSQVRALVGPTAQADALFGTNGSDNIDSGAGADTIRGQSGDDVLSGGTGQDLLDGSYGNDNLFGGADADTLQGGYGSDRLDGGSGNDTLTSGDPWDQDVVVFGSGYGQDVLTDFYTGDSIEFSGALTLSDLIFSRSYENLVVQIQGTNDRLTVTNYFSYAAGNMVVGTVGGQSFTHQDIMGVTTLPTSGNDLIYGDRLGNVLAGGAGNDSLRGGWGDDTYVFNLGDGSDTILDNSGTDTLLFGPGILASDVIVSTTGYNITLTIAGTSDSISADGVDYFRFADGTEWDRNLALANLPVTSGNDILLGSDTSDLLFGGDGHDSISGAGGDDSILGGAGDDYIDGGWGNDTLDGGSGNDEFEDSSGNDIYVFGRGSGQDWVYDDEGVDSVQFGADIAPSDIIATRDWYDLVLTIDGTSDSITIADFFSYYPEARIEEFRFVGVPAWTWADLLPLVSTTDDDEIYDGEMGSELFGSDGYDSIYGNGGDDIIDGGAGDDWLDGGDGSNTFLFGRGSGSDWVEGWGSWSEHRITNTLQLGAGITFSDLAIAGAGFGDLAITIIDTGETVTISNYFDPDYRFAIRFADGTSLTHLMVMNAISGATSGDDSISGDEHSNTLAGGLGNDVITGRDGDDQLTGGDGNDILQGGTGSDLYIFEAGFGQDRILDGEGWLIGEWDSIVFGPGIVASSVTFGRYGYDLIIDTGGGNAVTIERYFQHSQYRIESLHFADGTILRHRDIMQSLIQSTSGDDTLTGDEDGSTLIGGEGNDTLLGSTNAYLLSGADVLDGGAGNDLLRGANGSDLYIFKRGYGVDIVDETTGSVYDSMRDALQFGPDIALSDLVFSRDGYNQQDLRISIVGTSDAVIIRNYFAMSASGSRVNTIERIVLADGSLVSHSSIMAAVLTPTTGNDTLLGDERANIIHGGLGDDTLEGFAGNDLLYGDDGNDMINGGAGIDAIYGGDGNDLIKGLGGDIVDGGAGIDTFEVVTSSGTIATFDLNSQEFVGIENLKGGVGRDTLIGDGSANVLQGNGNIDTLIGNDGNDTLDGVDSGVTDTLTGGTGDDLYLRDGADVVTELANEGTDTVVTSATYTLTNHVENLTLGGTNAINGTGNTLDNVLVGNSGINVLTGLGGSDSLSGGNGNDILIGGAGADILTGGANNDTFRFATGDSGLGAGADRITDFVSAADKLDLAGIDANSLLGGDQAFAFIGTGAFSNSAGQLRYSVNGSDTWVQGDVDGDGIADFTIILSGTVTIVSGDLIV